MGFSAFGHIIKKQGFVILDGALATELEARGANLNHLLWSAKLLTEDPSMIRQVHLDYLNAGANVITTASYQASFIGFEKQGYSSEDAIELMKLSVNLAIEARDIFLFENRNKNSQVPIIAASLGPYGAALADGSEYTGYDDVSISTLRSFHAERLNVMLDTEADILAFETIPCLNEAMAIKELLHQYPSKKAWISFSCKDGLHLCSGALFEDAVKLLYDSNEVIGIGVNCTAPQHIESLINVAVPLTQQLILVYPNKGEEYDPIQKKWEVSAKSNPDFIENAKVWIGAGANAIGGCCRTSPTEIQQLNGLIN